MKIIIYTKDPKALYITINEKIKEKEFKTWEIKLNLNNDILYNHTPEQWSNRVLMKPILYKEYLEFNTQYWENGEEPDEDTKGYYIGRFTEILMVHFRDSFDSLKIHK